MQDMEQILSNFIPYANPYIVLAWKEPAENSTAEPIEIRTEVLWSTQINMNNPTETTYSEKFRSVADTSFTIKGWMFRNKNEESAPIYFIDYNLTNARTDFNFQDGLSALDYESFVNSLSDDTNKLTLSGYPTITNVYFNASGSTIEAAEPVTITKTQTYLDQYTYQIVGKNFNRAEFVMLSSNSTMNDNLTAITTKHTGDLTGYLLPESAWTVVSDNVMNVTFPQLIGSGRVDLIVKNPAGFKSTADIPGFYFNAQ